MVPEMELGTAQPVAGTGAMDSSPMAIKKRSRFQRAAASRALLATAERLGMQGTQLTRFAAFAAVTRRAVVAMADGMAQVRWRGTGVSHAADRLVL
jgi:hypothetical protein